MLTQSRSLLFLAAFYPLCASDAVGPFQYARLLAAQPTVNPLQLCADPTKVETAIPRTGWTYDSGLIDISMWAGRNLTGSRSRGANQLYLDPGPHMQDFWLGAKTWDTFTGTLQPAGWTYVRRQQQDWTMRFGYVATGAGSIQKSHGAATIVGEPQLFDQLVVELPMRFLASSTGGIPRWQVTWYRGVPNQTGVWRVPAGLSMSQAQGNANNRLADIGPFLSTFSPANGTWSMRLTTTGGGAWQLEIDRNGDHAADATYTSVANNLIDTRVPGVEGQSGLLSHFGPITASQTQVSYVNAAISYWRPKPVVQFAQPTWSAGENSGNAQVTLSLDRAALDPASVVISANLSGRLAGVGPVVIPTGTTTIPLVITGIDNQVDEPDTVVTLTLGQPSGVTLGAQATSAVTVVDDDEPVASNAVFFTDTPSVTAYDHLPRLNYVATVDPTQIGLDSNWIDTQFWQPVEGPLPLPVPLVFQGIYSDIFPNNDGSALLSGEFFNLSVATAPANLGFVSFANADLNGAPAIAVRWSYFNGDPDTYLMIGLESFSAIEPSLFVAQRSFDPRKLAVTIGDSFQLPSTRPWKPGPGALDVSTNTPGDVWLGKAEPFSSDPFARFVFVERGFDTEPAAVAVTYSVSGDQVVDPTFGDVRGVHTTQPIQRPPENSLIGLGYGINGSTTTLDGIRHGTLSILPGGYIIGTPAENQITLDDQIDPALVGDDLVAYTGQQFEIVVHVNRPVNRLLNLQLNWVLNAFGGIPLNIPVGTTDQLAQIPLPAGVGEGDTLWLQLTSSEIGVVDTEGDYVKVTVAAPVQN